MRRCLNYLFNHRADVLAAVVYGCLAFLSFSALAGYTNAHTLPNGDPLFPDPWGGYALAVAVDGAVLYAFISFQRAPWLAGLLLVSGAAATYTLQRWHAQGALHPLMIAGVVPGAMVLVTFAWHRIRAAEPAARPVWDPLPPPPPDPDPDEEPAEEPVLVPQTRPRVAQDGARRPGPATRGRPSAEVVQRAAQGHSAARIARDLGLSDRARRTWVGDLVREYRDQPVQLSPNGHGPGGGS